MLCFHWTFTESRTLGLPWVLGLKAAHTGKAGPQPHPQPQSRWAWGVTILLPELLKPECSQLRGSRAQQLCLRKGGSGSCLQPPREINVFEYWRSQESFQLDCRKLNKSWVLIRIQTSWIKIRNYPASLYVVCGTHSIKCLGFPQNWRWFCNHTRQDHHLVPVQARGGYVWSNQSRV